MNDQLGVLGSGSYVYWPGGGVYFFAKGRGHNHCREKIPPCSNNKNELL